MSVQAWPSVLYKIELLIVGFTLRVRGSARHQHHNHHKQANSIFEIFGVSTRRGSPVPALAVGHVYPVVPCLLSAYVVVQFSSLYERLARLQIGPYSCLRPVLGCRPLWLAPGSGLLVWGHSWDVGPIVAMLAQAILWHCRAFCASLCSQVGF